MIKYILDTSNEVVIPLTPLEEHQNEIKNLRKNII